NMPARHVYRDLSAASEDLAGGYEERGGRIILAGGEVLVDPVREEVLYPALEAIQKKYAAQAAEGLPVKVIVQTTGDLVTPQIVEDLLKRGAWMISCAGMDDFHVAWRATSACRCRTSCAPCSKTPAWSTARCPR
ncbi:MAG: hypothetical protein AAF074_12425, partial [Pseudomonadota bacterium]